MKKNNAMFSITMLLPLMFSLALIFSGCGASGGGGGDGDGDGGNLNASYASLAAGALVQAIDLTELSDILEDLDDIFISNNFNNLQSNNFLYTALKKVIIISKTEMLDNEQIEAMGSISEPPEGCSDGGTIALNATWDGPNPPVTPAQMSNLDATLTFNSCTIETETFDGSIRLIFTGTLDNPTRLRIYSSGYSYSDSAEGHNFQMTDLDFDIAGSTIELSVTLSGTAENDEFDGLYINYGSSQNSDEIFLSGMMKPSCLDEWITITTFLQIIVPAGENCPMAGLVGITADDNTVMVEIESDARINIIFNGTLVNTYSSCSDLDGICS